jgi:hypothetical protein
MSRLIEHIDHTLTRLRGLRSVIWRALQEADDRADDERVVVLDNRLTTVEDEMLRIFNTTGCE